MRQGRLALAVFLIGSLASCAGRAFEVFDGTRLAFPEEFRQMGMKPMCIVYPGELWGDASLSKRLLPPEDKIRAAARRARDCSHVVIDIETWQPRLGKGPMIQALNAQYRDNYVRFTQIWKAENPQTRLGYFNIPRPVDNYPAIVEDPRREGEYREVQGELLRVLKGRVDFAVTSAYWKRGSQKDNAHWWGMARALAQEVWGAQTPHYYFAWWRGVGPDYKSEKRGSNAWLDIATWKFIMDWIMANADGVILWSQRGEETLDPVPAGLIVGKPPDQNWSTGRMLKEQVASNYTLTVPEAQWISDLRNRLLKLSGAAGDARPRP